VSNEIVRFSAAEIEVMAHHVAKSRLFGVDQSQAFTLMLIAQAKGLHPIEAMERYHVIQGRPAMRADAMLAEFQARGGTVEWVETTNEVCHAIFRHPIHAPKGCPSSFGPAEVRKAGLDKKKGPWEQYPANMLRARVIANGIRMVLPGVLSGIYSSEEVQDMAAETAPAPAAPAPAAPAPVPPPATVRNGGNGNHTVPPGQEPWASYVARIAREANDAWHAELAYNGVPADKRANLINQYQITQEITTRAVKQGLIDLDAITQPNRDGVPVRVAARVLKAVADLFREHREGVERNVEDYMAEKFAGARRQLGLANPDAPNTPAEGEELAAGRTESAGDAAGGNTGDEVAQEDHA
jgi:hypothetical protein